MHLPILNVVAPSRHQAVTFAKKLRVAPWRWRYLHDVEIMAGVIPYPHDVLVVLPTTPPTGAAAAARVDLILKYYRAAGAKTDHDPTVLDLRDGQRLDLAADDRLAPFRDTSAAPDA